MIRDLRVRILLLLVLALTAAIIVPGCRILGNDEEHAVTETQVFVNGVVVQPNANVVMGNGPSANQGTPLANVRVWIEEYPEYFDDTDANGAYSIQMPWKGSSLHVVARIINAGKAWKNRSGQELQFENGVAKSDLSLFEAQRYVIGRLFDAEGNPFAANVPLYVWGEVFYTEAGGWFRSPPLPDSFNVGQVVFRGNGAAGPFILLAPFVSADYPAYVETRLPPVAGGGNMPPTVYLTATRNGTPVTVVTGGQELQVTATAADTDSEDAGMLTPEWTVSRGQKAGTADPFAITWTAPADSGLATITVQVRDSKNNVTTCALPVVVNVAQPSDTTAPTVVQLSAVQADGNFIPGNSIDVTVQFSEVVRVTGTPQVKLETGATDRYATYLSGDNSNTMTCRYVVQAGDANLDLDYTGTDALELNSGTIKDAAGNGANLNLPAPGAAGSLGNNKTLKVGTPPAAQVAAGAPANPSATALYSITVGGANVVAYKYNLDNANSGAFSAEAAVANPVAGTLADGEHTLKIIGRDANGFWQTEANATVVTWTVRANTYAFNRRIGGVWSLTDPGQVHEASDLTVDGDGNIYVADQDNSRIQKFNSNGVFVTTWGSEGVGDTQFRWPRGIAFDGTYLWVADTSNKRIVKYNTEGVYQGKWATGADDPIGIACANGKIYVGQRGANITVVAYNSAGVVQHTSATFPNGMAETATPQDVAVDADGNVFMGGENGKIYKMPADLSSVALVYNSNVDGGYVPKGIGITGTGATQYLYASFSDSTIRKIKTTDGSRVATYGQRSSAPGDFYNPTGVLITGGSVLVAEYYRVQKLDLNMNSQAIFANKLSADGNLWQPNALAFDAAGNFYVADTNNMRVQKFNSAGAFVTKWGHAGSADGNGRPQGIAVDFSGNVYVSDQDNDRVQKFSSDGVFLAKWGVSGTNPGQLNIPQGVVVDAGGNLHIVDSSPGYLQVFTPAGEFVRRIADGQVDSPRFSAVDSDGNIYVSDRSNRRIKKFSAIGTFLSEWSTTGFPSGIAIDAAGNSYVADLSSNIIRKFDSAGNAVCTIGTGLGAGDGQMNGPQGVALDQLGNVFIIDSNTNNRVQVFSPQ